MFNFSANHLFLLSRTEYPSCAVFLFKDLDTQRVYLVIESVRPDTKHARCSPVPVPDDGAGGSPIA